MQPWNIRVKRIKRGYFFHCTDLLSCTYWNWRNRFHCNTAKRKDRGREWYGNDHNGSKS